VVLVGAMAWGRRPAAADIPRDQLVA
jgi:hypothetical protein